MRERLVRFDGPAGWPRANAADSEGDEGVWFHTIRTKNVFGVAPARTRTGVDAPAQSVSASNVRVDGSVAMAISPAGKAAPSERASVTRAQRCETATSGVITSESGGAASVAGVAVGVGVGPGAGGTSWSSHAPRNSRNQPRCLIEALMPRPPAVRAA